MVPGIHDCHCFSFVSPQILPQLWKSPQLNGHTIRLSVDSLNFIFLKADFRLHCGRLVLRGHLLGINIEAPSTDLPWVTQLGSRSWATRFCPVYCSHLSVLWCVGQGGQQEAKGAFKFRLFGEPLIKGLFTKVWV